MLEPVRPLPASAIAALSLAHLLAMADRSAFAAIAPLLALRYGLSNTQLGVLLGPALAVTYGVAAIGFGALADRRPPHRLVLAGLAIMAMASLASAASSTYPVMLVSRILLGVGMAAVIPAAMLLIVRTSIATAKPRVLAIFTGASAIGRSAGLMLAGGVLAVAGAFDWPLHTLGWRIVLLATALPAMILLVTCARIVPAAVPRREERQPAAARDGTLIARLAPHFAAAIGPILLSQSLTAWMPALLIRRHGFDAATAATFFGAILFVMGPGAQYLGALATDRIGWLTRRPIIGNAACLVVAQPLLLLATRTDSAWLIGLGLAGVTLATGLAAFITLYAVQTLAPPARRGSVTGLFLALATLVGAGSGPLLTGILSDTPLTRDGPGALGSALAIVGALAAGISVFTAIILAPGLAATASRERERLRP